MILSLSGLMKQELIKRSNIFIYEFSILMKNRFFDFLMKLKYYRLSFFVINEIKPMILRINEGLFNFSVFPIVLV